MKKLNLITLLALVLFGQLLQAQSWNLTGNSGTNPATHFIGTLDNQPLSFRVNNVAAGRIDAALYNVSFGTLANSSATTGQSNTAVGQGTLALNSVGSENTAMGSIAMQKNTSGNWNTAVGHGALFNTNSSANTAVGDLALTANTNGSANTAVGEDALRRNTSGIYNTALGENAIHYNVTGSYNTGLGRATSIINLNNATALGYAATVAASNKIRLGNTAVTSLESQVNLSVTSDGRFKSNLREDVHGLDFIMRLRPVSYNYDIQALNEFYGIPARMRADNADKPGDLQKELAALDAAEQEAAAIRHTGFIAQDVAEAAAECGYHFTGVVPPQNEQDLYALRYAEFTIPLVKAVQEQQAIIEQQERRLKALEERLQSLGASAPEAPGSLDVSPNPSSGALSIRFNAQNEAAYALSILAQNGAQVFAQKGNSRMGDNELKIRMPDLAPGVYTLRLEMGATVYAKQVVVVR